jgi:hypothetical protein
MLLVACGGDGGSTGPREASLRVVAGAGVSDTIFRGSDGRVITVPSSSVTVTGNAGGGDGLAVGGRVAVGAAVATAAAGLGDGDGEAAPAQAARTMARPTSRATRGPANVAGRVGRYDIRLEPPVARGGVATNRETPRSERVERGV